MSGYSIELCGGTHLDNTAKVGPFRIESEYSVASGVRRIEAITGKESLAEMDRTRQRIYDACAVLKTKPAELATKLEGQVEEIKTLKKAVESYKAKEAAGETERFLFGAHDIGGLKVLTVSVPDADANKLRQMGDMLRDKDASVVAVLASVVGEKITFLAVCGKDAVARGIKAGEIVKLVCTTCGGSGGGKPDSAMGGGKDATKVDNALALVDDFVSSKLK
jgi:alanyl-tRNA synthetase